MEFKLRKLLLILFIFSLFIISCEKDEVQNKLSCNTCDTFSTCQEAYEALNNGCSDLDRDNDGVPCESICPGG